MVLSDGSLSLMIVRDVFSLWRWFLHDSPGGAANWCLLYLNLSILCSKTQLHTLSSLSVHPRNLPNSALAELSALMSGIVLPLPEITRIYAELPWQLRPQLVPNLTIFHLVSRIPAVSCHDGNLGLMLQSWNLSKFLQETPNQIILNSFFRWFCLFFVWGAYTIRLAFRDMTHDPPKNCLSPVTNSPRWWELLADLSSPPAHLMPATTGMGAA